MSYMSRADLSNELSNAHNEIKLLRAKVTQLEATIADLTPRVQNGHNAIERLLTIAEQQALALGRRIS